MQRYNQTVLAASEVRAVVASAGSGKTYALARRYLKLLICPASGPEENYLSGILAITFTNKAAFEMKARIIEFLKRLALDMFQEEKEKKELIAYLGVEEEYARKKAYSIMDNIIKNYNYFQVQTIDSFINALLSGCAFKLDLSSSFKIRNDFRDYLAYSFDRHIDRALVDKKVLSDFLSFLDNYINLENKKSWFPKKDIIVIMEQLFNAVNTYGRSFMKFPKSARELMSKKEHIRDLMLKLKKNLPEGLNMRTWGKFVKSFEEEVRIYELEDFFGPFSKDDFLMCKGYSLPDETFNLWLKIKRDIAEFYQWKAFSLFNCYIDIFEGVMWYFKEISKKDDVVFLSELNNQARRLFEDYSLSVPELYYRFAARFCHFLIDEFQDTSRLQWRNLFPMIEEALSTGGTLYYVGDKKQAIYRFRGGDVSLMERVKEDLRVFNIKPPVVLGKNYRSQKAVVEFNNMLFSESNLKRFIAESASFNKNSPEFTNADIEEILNVFDAATQEYKAGNEGGVVKIEQIEGDKKEDNDRIIKDKLTQLISGLIQRGFSYKDIALLTRTNKEVEKLTSWLLEEGIPVESEKTLNIRENSFVKEIMALLRFLNSPIDNLSFAVFILGDIFVKAGGLSKETIRDFLFSAARSRDAQKVYLYRKFRERFPREWENYFEDFFKSVGFVPFYELVISILGHFKVMDNFLCSQAFFMKLLEVIKEQEQEYYTLDSFLEYFDQAHPEDLYVYVSGTNSVQSLTVHKAKGLEFPVVIIPSFQMNVQVGSGSDKNRAFIVRAEDAHISLNYLRKDESLDFSEELRGRFRDEYKKSFIDELNSVYVSCTRAQYELYIFIPARSAKKKNLAAALIPAGYTQQGETGSYERKERARIFSMAGINPCEYKDWVQFLKNEFVDENVIISRDKILRGEILHFILSRIGNLYKQDTLSVIDGALDDARRAFVNVKNWQGYKKTVVRLITDKKMSFFFNNEKARVFTEKEVVNSSGNTFRIDRMVITGDEVFIIDYKSSRDEGEAYREQLKRYMDIMGDIYPGYALRGFLVYLDETSMEEINEKSNNG